MSAPQELGKFATESYGFSEQLEGFPEKNMVFPTNFKDFLKHLAIPGLS
jgi:hypothetical protein